MPLGVMAPEFRRSKRSWWFSWWWRRGLLSPAYRPIMSCKMLCFLCGFQCFSGVFFKSVKTVIFNSPPTPNINSPPKETLCDDNTITIYVIRLSMNLSLSRTGQYQCGISCSQSPMVPGCLPGYPRGHGESWLVHVGLRLLCYLASENHQTCFAVHLNRQVGKILSVGFLNFCFTIA